MNWRRSDYETHSAQEDWDEVGKLRGQALQGAREEPQEPIALTPKLAEGKLMEGNKDKLREIKKTIIYAVIISRDGKVLLGFQDDDWRLLTVEVGEGEGWDQAVKRGVQEQTGLDVSAASVNDLPYAEEDEAEQTLDTGEKVWCKMEFHQFEVTLPQSAHDTTVAPSGKIEKLQWFKRDHLPNVAVNR